MKTAAGGDFSPKVAAAIKAPLIRRPDQPPAAMHAAVANIFGDRLATALMNRSAAMQRM